MPGLSYLRWYNAAVLLNGWKDIAAYLKCGVRTAQRWHQDLHLPVVKVRNSARGPVMAESEKLDRWVRHRNSPAELTKESSTIIDQSSTIIERTATTIKKTTLEVSNFLRTELIIGREFANLATLSTNTNAVARRRFAARKAYDTVHRLLARKVYLPEPEMTRFKAELQLFKRELQKLGEKF